MTLIEFPGNRGQVFAVDPYRVIAVARHQATLAGRGAQLYEMTAVRLDDGTGFVCSWKLRDTLAKINEARAAGYGLWAAGYRTAAAVDWEEPGVPSEVDVRADFEGWLIEIDAPPLPGDEATDVVLEEAS